jgi:hypothetical protein
MAVLSTSATLMSPLTPQPDLATQVADLQARLAKIEKVLLIGSGGDVAIKADTSFRVDAGTTITVKGMSNVTLQSSAQMTVSASGTMTIKGSTLNLN